jgi:hypothetical protein
VDVLKNVLAKRNVNYNEHSSTALSLRVEDLFDALNDVDFVNKIPKVNSPLPFHSTLLVLKPDRNLFKLVSIENSDFLHNQGYDER